MTGSAMHPGHMTKFDQVTVFPTRNSNTGSADNNYGSIDSWNYDILIFLFLIQLLISCHSESNLPLTSSLMEWIQ